MNLTNVKSLNCQQKPVSFGERMRRSSRYNTQNSTQYGTQNNAPQNNTQYNYPQYNAQYNTQNNAQYQCNSGYNAQYDTPRNNTRYNDQYNAQYNTQNGGYNTQYSTQNNTGNNTRNNARNNEFMMQFDAAFKEPKSYRRNTKPSQNDLIRAIAVIMATAAISAPLGYSSGNSRGLEEGYKQGYEDGIQYMVEENAKQQQQQIMPFSDDYIVEEVPVATPEPYTYTPAAVELEGIPEAVSKLANTTNITELDLSQEVRLYNSEAKLPNYLVNTLADREVVRKAQYNLARLFQSGNNIYIYLKQDTTMGDIKAVYGILDGVLGRYESNMVSQRPQTEGSNGNYDNGIVKAGEVIMLEKFTEYDGNTIFRYAYHQSDKSHRIIIDAIERYAGEKLSFNQ